MYSNNSVTQFGSFVLFTCDVAVELWRLIVRCAGPQQIIHDDLKQTGDMLIELTKEENNT